MQMRVFLINMVLGNTFLASANKISQRTLKRPGNKASGYKVLGIKMAEVFEFQFALMLCHTRSYDRNQPELSIKWITDIYIT